METTKILVLDDSPVDRALAMRLLAHEAAETGIRLELIEAADLATGLALGPGAKAVLLDLGLPDCEGLEGVAAFAALEEQPAVVVLSGRNDEQTAIAALRCGAQDYLSKGRLRQSAGGSVLSTVIRSIERKRLEIDLKQAQLELAKAAAAHQSAMRAVLDRLAQGLLLLESAGRIHFANSAAARLLGMRVADLEGLDWWSCGLLPPGEMEGLRAAAGSGKRRPVIIRRGGEELFLEIDAERQGSGQEGWIVHLHDTCELERLRRQSPASELVGEGAAMKSLRARLPLIARSDLPVLIHGETGTGKELVARALHQASGRASAPFIAINCAGLAESILAGQLFGHRRGAFTGAADDRQGFIEAADGGTLFLDEIGDMQPELQRMLLRVLQEKELVRLGETRPRKVDVRILAATHRDLAEEVAAGRFRQDLLYRIRVARVEVPPLRQRKEDLPRLAAALLKGKAGLSPDAMRLLVTHSWPGNVRELDAVLQCAAMICRDGCIEAADLPDELFRSGSSPASPSSPAADPTASSRNLPGRPQVLAALQAAGGRRREAAAALGIGRSTLFRLLARWKAEGLD
ncbi:MAG: hypothetical protein RL095_512 [Verrucomicrobiota bacterium]|jgi:DNA-binding NtrC family response regulator